MNWGELKIVHTVKGLYELKQKPNLSKISLELLLKYYEQYLKPYRFTYTLSNGRTVNLTFEDEKFCHLLGIETVAIKKYKRKSHLTSPYKSVKGYRRIKEGKLTFKSLKQLEPNGFKSIKDKIIFFYLIPHILESPEIIIDYVQDPSVSLVNCKLMIFELLHGVYVHLGIEIEKGNAYFPRTFLVERITVKNDGTRFIANQPNLITIEKIEKSYVSNGEIISTIYPQKAKEISDSESEPQK